jgi:uncharacterized damage-inducible protein DinB
MWRDSEWIVCRAACTPGTSVRSIATVCLPVTDNSRMDSLPEPWMRGPIAGVDPLLAPVLYTFQQAREDLRRWTEGLSTGQLWVARYGFGSVGFHMRHIAGSTGRLVSYLQGKPLNAEQLATLQAEHDPAGTGRDELLALVDAAFDHAETVVRALDPGTLRESRGVGRQQHPTTVIGLLFHIAEHTQRHVGQAISAAKLAAV